MKKRKNRQHCVHLRVSQQAISDYWKMCDKSVHGENNIKEAKIHQENTGGKEKTIKMTHEHKEEISKKHDKYAAEEIEKDMVLKSGCKSPYVYPNKPCSDCSISSLSLRIAETKHEESESIRKSSNFKHTCDSNTKHFLMYMQEDTSSALERKSSSCRTSKIDISYERSKKTSNGKCSPSGTNFSETTNTDDYMNSILYYDIGKKCASTAKKKSSKDCLEIEKGIELKLTPEAEIKNTEKISSYQESDTDEIKSNFSDNTRVYSLKQKQKYNSKRPINKSVTKLQKKLPCRNIEIISDMQQKDTYPVSWYKNTVYQRKLPKCLCQSCYCDTKARNYDDFRWSSSKKQSFSHLQPYSSFQPRYNTLSMNLQPQRNNSSYECLRTKKKIDSVADYKFSLSHETRSSKFKPQSMQYKEKPTLVIFKNRRSNRSRNSTNSLYSSSSTSTSTIKRPVHDNLVTSQRSAYKSSRYTMPSSDQYKHNKNSAKIDTTSPLSSSSSLSSSKRFHSWTVLPRNAVYHKQEPISSSSYTDVHRWRRRYPETKKRTSSYLSSTTCSCSLSSLSTFRDYCLEESEKEARQIKKSRRKQRFRAQKKEIIYTDERHVRWNIKNMH
ncbi:uncharacterized protein LOC132912574 [Bombus pascuorum]|uniref:uncharacterized protein LOC132912574 n=1 Tax=Bombus pascuorum TaxID=65598 RepID=UPI00298DD0E5|nr:uncharacterized protein LOC132912574 [Bombus pascuorum]